VHEAIVRGNTLSTYAMVATTFLVIYLFWRRVAPTLITMLPVVAAVTVQYFITAIMGYEVTYVSIVLTGMAIGVGIDDAVHLVNRFKEEMANGRPAKDAAILANSEIGKVLVATTLTTISPFLMIIGSVIVWAKNTAWMTIPTVAGALIATIFVLPVVLAWHGERWPNAWTTPAERKRRQTGRDPTDSS
jgi:predicted RND superfamily exporter protein